MRKSSVSWWRERHLVESADPWCAVPNTAPTWASDGPGPSTLPPLWSTPPTDGPTAAHTALRWRAVGGSARLSAFPPVGTFRRRAGGRRSSARWFGLVVVPSRPVRVLARRRPVSGRLGGPRSSWCGNQWWRGFTTIDRLRASIPTNPQVSALSYAAAWAVALLDVAELGLGPKKL